MRSLANCRFLLALLLLLGCGAPAFAQDTNSTSLPPGFQRWEFEVEGVERKALAYVPGSAQNGVRKLAMNRHWPEAISIYMQGLNTPGRLTDPQGKAPGWQKFLGD